MFSSVTTDEKFDVIIFNPPYVATPLEELENAQKLKGIEASWAGGVDGIQVLREFFYQAINHLSDLGCIYILMISDNVPFLNEIDKF